jgi:hypothetical protein
MSKQNLTPTWAKKSPWLDPMKTSPIGNEFRLIEDLKIDTWLEQVDPYCKPLEIYRWIDLHDGKSLLFEGLASYAPLFPAKAYNGVAAWISPPPAGFGNAVCMVMGHDKSGELRLVGGNNFVEPRCQSGSPSSSIDFFAKYDLCDDRNKQRLVFDTVSKSIDDDAQLLLLDVGRVCDHFSTMAVYLTVLTPESSWLHVFPAVIDGDRPADFSYEFFGEIK